MKALLLIALTIYLSACEQSGSSTPAAAVGGITEPITEPIPETLPIVWQSPTTTSSAEIEFRGLYRDQSNQNNYIEVLNGTIRGSIETTERYSIGGGNYGFRPTLCTFAGNISQFNQYDAVRFGLVVSLTSWSHYSSLYYARDCFNNNGSNQSHIDSIKFPSEKCIIIELGASTGPKTFCKE